MWLSENTMNNIENVYFLWGRGKTTIANILRDRFGFYVYSADEARDRLMLVATPEKRSEEHTSELQSR